MFSYLMPFSWEYQTPINRNISVLHLPCEKAVVLDKLEVKKVRKEEFKFLSSTTSIPQARNLPFLFCTEEDE